jgi:hypothetical protein
VIEEPDMYGYIWRILPGSIAVRVVLAALVVVAVGLLLWYVVFPEFAAWLTADDTPPVVTQGNG